MHSRRALVVFALVVASCTDDCACGEGQPGEDPAGGAPGPGSAPRPGDPGWADEERAPQRDPDFRAIDAGAKAGTHLDREGGHFARLESPDLPRFETLQKKLTSSPVEAKKLASADDLEEALPSDLGDYEATGEPAEGPSAAGRSPILVRSRMYQRGSQRMVVKVTDTGQAPELRDDYVRRLTLQGDVSVGRMAPAIVGDEVVLEAFFPVGRSSWATGLVGGRYLVEIRARDADHPKVATEAFAALKLSDLSR